MGRTWILDTDTKGTGAQMVPIEKTRDDSPARAPVIVRPKPERPPAEKQPTPRRFKVIDVMSRRVLAEGADARTTVGVLRDARSIVDVGVYVWRPEAETWRMLSHREKSMLWEAAEARRR